MAESTPLNSAIDELIPANYRGRVDLIVNGSFWLGAAAGALAVPFLLDQRLFAPDIGWRLGFGIGAVLGLGILLLRRFVPESPRWLVTHEQNDKRLSETIAEAGRPKDDHPSPKKSLGHSSADGSNESRLAPTRLHLARRGVLGFRR